MFPIKRELTTKNFRYTKHKLGVTQKKNEINVNNNFQIIGNNDVILN